MVIPIYLTTVSITATSKFQLDNYSIYDQVKLVQGKLRSISCGGGLLNTASLHAIGTKYKGLVGA